MQVSYLVLALGTFLLSVSGKRLREQRMYLPIQAATFCFRRTNGTHQFGCSSEVGGNVGVVHLVKEEADVDWLLSHKKHAPYVAAFTPFSFTKETINRLIQGGILSGAIVLDPPESEEWPTPKPEAYSEDNVCPNSISSLYRGTPQECSANQRPWNPRGSGFLQTDFPFPVFYTNDANATNAVLDDCYRKFNEPSEDGEAKDWPLCAMELDSHMYSAVDTKTCIRRSNIVNVVSPTKFCDPMGDRNYFLFLKERNASSAREEEKEDSVIVLSTRLDTVTLFDRTELGGDSPVTGIVALLETARLLAQTPPLFDSKVSNLLFAFFQGESFDYIGSSRFVYDMQNGLFPHELNDEHFPNGQQPLLNLTQIEMMIELGQLYNVKSGGRLFVHNDAQSGNENLKAEMVSKLNELRLSASQAKNAVLPPASLHSFLKAKRDFSGLFVSDFDESYSNPYFHSVYDSSENNLNYNYSLGANQALVEHIGKISQALAEFVYKTTSSRQRSLPVFPANLTLINELLHCYLDTARCPLFLAASNANTPPYATEAPDSPHQQYVGVDYRAQWHGILTRNVLTYLTGERLEGDIKASDCKPPEKQAIFDYLFLKTEDVPTWWKIEHPDTPCNQSSECGFCFKTLSFSKSAVSPAFIIEDYDFSDSSYSAWAESVWKSGSARIFLKASPVMEKAHFSLGVIVLFFSFVFVIWIDRYAKDLFDDDDTPLGENNSSSGPDSNAEPVHL